MTGEERRQWITKEDAIATLGLSYSALLRRVRSGRIAKTGREEAMNDPQKLIRAAAREQKEHAEWLLPVHLGPTTALQLVGNLQLALRHPGNTGPAADLARQIVTGITAKLREAGFKATAQLAELGNASERAGAPQ